MFTYAALIIAPALILRRIYGLRIIGLTGGISSGKSTASSYLVRHHHLLVIDFDILARDVVHPQHRSGLLGRIVKEFESDAIAAAAKSTVNSSPSSPPPSSSLLLPDGTLDRAALGRLIFHTPSARVRLSAMMRPAIWSAFFVAAFRLFFIEGKKEIVIDVPLLFESKLDLVCADTIVINVNDDVQIQRLMKRDSIDSSSASAKITSQWSLARKCALASIVISNDGTVDDLESKLDDWVRDNKSKQETQSWWRWYVPTVPTLVTAAIVTPIFVIAESIRRCFM